MAYTTVRGKLVKIPTHSYGMKFKKVLVDGNQVLKHDPLRKGEYMGLCNRTACQAPGPTWWNTGSRSYYCGRCAQMINVDGCSHFNEPDICFKVTGFDLNNQPQFDPLAKKDYHAEYRLRSSV